MARLCSVLSLLVLVAVLSVAMPAVVATPEQGPRPGTVAHSVLVRDQLIADQENLLNVYRCLFGVDVEVVQGGCVNPVIIEVGVAPLDPTIYDLDERDWLVRQQEALLNVYRCEFDVDVELVLNGCQDGVVVENLGPVSVKVEVGAEYLRLLGLLVDCGWFEHSWRRQCWHDAYPLNDYMVVPARADLVTQIEISREWAEFYGCDTAYAVTQCKFSGIPAAEVWERRIALAEYQEACGFGVTKIGFSYWSCSDMSIPHQDAELVRLVREAYDCRYDIGRSGYSNTNWCPGVWGYGGEWVRLRDDLLFCDSGWFFEQGMESDGSEINGFIYYTIRGMRAGEREVAWSGFSGRIGYCYHPDHPDVAHRHW